MGKYFYYEGEKYLPIGLTRNGTMPSINMTNHNFTKVLNSPLDKFSLHLFKLPYIRGITFKEDFNEESLKTWYLKNKMLGIVPFSDIVFFPDDIPKFAPVPKNKMQVGKLYHATTDAKVMKTGSDRLIIFPIETLMLIENFTDKERNEYLSEYLKQGIDTLLFREGLDVRTFALMQDFYTFTCTTAKFF